MSQEQNNSKNQTRSIARQLARELHPEELDVVSAGCTCANTSTPCGVDDQQAK
jgi:hypothetical protein